MPKMQKITADNGSRQPMFLALLGLLLLFSTITVILRFYCRIVYVKYVGTDDYFIVAAFLVVLGMSVANVIHVSYGTGRHLADLPPEILIPTLKHWYAYQLVYPFALLFVKASILALYYRIFSQKAFKISVWVMATIVATYTVVVVFVNAFECPHKISNAWSPKFPKGCNNLPKAYFSMAGVSIATDFLILVLPIPVLVKLNVPRNRRWALIGIFMTGSVAVAASIVRLNALYIYTVSKDVSYDAIYILLWSQVECNIAIITACIPPLRPIFKGTFRGNSSGRSRREGGSKYAGEMFPPDRRFKGQELVEFDVYSRRHSELQNTVSGGPDNESEEHILSSGRSGILKTMCVETVSNPTDE